jgi:hypothetical protein
VVATAGGHPLPLHTEREFVVSKQIEKDWFLDFEGKTIQSIKTKHEENNVVPYVTVEFTDGSQYEIYVRDGAFFEGCMINTLRKAQPVVDVMVVTEEDDTIVEVAAATFPLFMLMATNKRLESGVFPFWLEQVEPSNG